MGSPALLGYSERPPLRLLTRRPYTVSLTLRNFFRYFYKSFIRNFFRYFYNSISKDKALHKPLSHAENTHTTPTNKHEEPAGNARVRSRALTAYPIPTHPQGHSHEEEKAQSPDAKDGAGSSQQGQEQEDQEVLATSQQVEVSSKI